MVFTLISKKHIISKGNAAGAGDQVGTVLYSRGVLNAAYMVEAARTAQAIHGVSDYNSRYDA